MLKEKTCINVYSESNEWIDFCIVFDDVLDYVMAEEIVQKAYDDWFELETDEPIADYISQRLTECEIEHEIYFKAEEN